MQRSFVLWVTAVLVLACLSGCGRTRERGSARDGGRIGVDGGDGVDGGGGPAMCDGVTVDLSTDPTHCGACGNACAVDQECREGSCCTPTIQTTTGLDLLFMIDNSNSMAEEQASLANELPQITSALATGDLNGDGTVDFTPPSSIQVGVVTADMGTGGFTVPTCSEPSFGDDGILRTEGNRSVAGCAATYPSFLTWSPESGQSPSDFATDISCVALVGTGGCGFEQQLDAVLKAVTPSTSPARFVMDTTGHADGANAGFLRPDSVLALVLLTDEEDCSAADPELFNPSSSVYSGNLNLRCFSYPMAMHPLERYVDGLLATRESPGHLVYALIAGVPPDLVSDGASYESMLADPRMQERVDPSDPNRLTPSCDVPGRGLAFPPRRMVELARQLDAAGAAPTVQSICQADFSPATGAILQRVAAAFEPREVCLP